MVTKRNITHESIDQRSLALDVEIARMIREQPELLNRAKATLRRWIEAREPEVPEALLEWGMILNSSNLEEILDLLVRDDEEARRLRQSSPFCGILPEERRLAILGQFPNAPQELRVSQEADIFPRIDPDRAIEIDGAIGERSLFHDTHGYYAHGVGETTATLPTGWEQRLVPVKNANTGDGTGWCLEVHDLALSKLAAGRDKDMRFVEKLIDERMVQPEELKARIKTMPLMPDQQTTVQERLNRILNRGYNPNTRAR